MTDEEYEMRQRIAATYTDALKASHGDAAVSIHVGQDVWDYLHSLATHPPTSLIPTPLIFGFPLVLEMGWEPRVIQVRTTKVIA